MSILNNLLSGLTGIGVMFVFLNGYLALRGRQAINMAYVLIGLGVLVYIPCNLFLYQTEEVSLYLDILRIQMFGTAIYHIGLLALYGQYMQFPVRPLLFVYLPLFGFFLVARLLNPLFTYTFFTGMQHYLTFWGEIIHMPVSQVSLWGYLYTFLVFSVYGVAIIFTIRQVLRGQGQHVALVLASQLVLLGAFFHDMVVFTTNVRWFFMGEIGFVIVIALMEIALANDALRARALARELNEANTQLERRVLERTAQLEAANKELEAFSYSVSHDLRAPLRAINGFAKILSEDFAPDLPPAAQGFLQKIMQSGKRMASLIDNLLDFSRLGRKPLNLQMVDLAALLEIVRESLSTETANRQIEWLLPEKWPTVQADPILLQQVYANLLANAVKYTGKLPAARIEIGYFVQKGETVYFVRDNGAGFDMQYADKLFGVFQRLHRDDEFEGNGIGLATVRRIVERHSGRIWAESEPGKGATFFFTLG